MSAQDKDSDEDIEWIRLNKKYSEIKDLPDGLRPADMPEFRGKAMPFSIFEMAYTSTHWLIINGRHLIPQEIEGMIYEAYPTKRRSRDSFNGIHDKINNPHAKTTTVLNNYPLKKKVALRDKAAQKLGKYLEDEKAKQRYEGLKGFVGKLTPYPKEVPLKTRPKLADIYLYEEQTYFIGALIRWCMGKKNSIAWEMDARVMVRQGLGLWIPKSFEVYRDLANESHPHAKFVAKVLDQPNHATYFGRQARQCHVECSRIRQLKFPVESYPDIPAESEPLPATTAEYFAAMTISAPAESSRQLTATNAPAGSSHQPFTPDVALLDFDEFLFDEFLKSDAYEESIAESLHDFDSEPEAAPPTAGGRSPKGKGRVRESSSPESQEGGGSGKGKQAVRKKPRGGK